MKIKNIVAFAVLTTLSLGLISNVNAATIAGPFSSSPPILKDVNSTNARPFSAKSTNSSIVLIASGIGAAGPNGTCVTQNNCFNPHIINITTGQNVTWNNTDNVVHTITSGMPIGSTIGKLFDKSIPPGSTVSITFNDTGKINYFCTIHPWMKGEVIVEQSHDLGTNSQNTSTNFAGNIDNLSQDLNSSSQNASKSQGNTLVTNSSNQTHP